MKQYNTIYPSIVAIYTAKQLIGMNKIRIPGPDASEKRRNDFEFPNTVMINGISEFSCEIFNKDEQFPNLKWFPIYYRKVRIIKVCEKSKERNEKIFYILDDLVSGRLNEYGYLKDDTILEMLKKYKYIEEEE